jgi:hypothetical protein
MGVIISRLRDCSLYCTMWYQLVSSHERIHSSFIGLLIKCLETTSLCHDLKILSTLYIWLKSALFQDVVHLPSAGSQLQDHCAFVTQSEMMENVQYMNFFYDSSHCVYCSEIQTEYTFKHNILMPYNMVYFVFQVQYMCHICDILVTGFQTYDLSL